MSTYDAYLIARGLHEDLLTLDTLERWDVDESQRSNYRAAADKKLAKLVAEFGFSLVPLSTEQKEAA